MKFKHLSLVGPQRHGWVGHWGAVRTAKRSKSTRPQLKDIWFTSDSKCKTGPEAQTPGNTQKTLGRCWELTTVHHCEETPLWVYRMPFSLLFTPSHPAPSAQPWVWKWGWEDRRPKEMKSSGKIIGSVRGASPAHHLHIRLTDCLQGLTCDVQVEGDLLAPGLAAVLPSVRLARLLHHQLPGAALGLQMHFRARTQLLAVLVPRHLRLGLGHLAAQRGTGSHHGLHIAACRLLLGKHHRGFWGHRGGDTGSETPPQSGRQPRAEKTWMGSWEVRWWEGVMELETFPGSAPALCFAEDTLSFSAASHTNHAFSHRSMWNGLGKRLLKKTSPLLMTSAFSRCKYLPTFQDSAPVFSIRLCKELFICSQWRCLRLSTQPTLTVFNLWQSAGSACTCPRLSLPLSEEWRSWAPFPWGLGSSLLFSSQLHYSDLLPTNPW